MGRLQEPARELQVAALLESGLSILRLPPASQRHAKQRTRGQRRKRLRLTDIREPSRQKTIEVVVVLPVGAEREVAIRDPEPRAVRWNATALTNVAVVVRRI